MGRAPCCEKVGLKRGRWTREEDDILARYIREHGEGAWRSLPKNAGLLRCGKSCRLRWINYLRADLKRGNISREEEEMIIRLHATLGNRWSLIAGHFPGRTDNEIKNHWNSHLCKRERDLRDGTVVDVDLTKLPGGGKRRGGRARSVKASLKKGKGKDKRSRKAKSKAAENHEEEDGGISASPPPQGEEQAHACASGVTSDGLDEGALGLCEEMVSGLKGQPSPNPDVTPDVSNIEPPMAADHGELGSNKAMELDRDDGRCNESESVPGVPAEPAGQAGLGGTKAVEMGGPGCCNEADSGPSEAMGSDKDMEWDLVGLDENLARDDLWTSLVWDYDEVVPPAGAQEEEAVLSDLFFFDDM